MALTTVEHEWKEYARHVLPHVSEQSVQYVETRKAFFAGAFVLYQQMREIGEPHIKEGDALKHLVDLKAEFDRMALETLNDEPRNR